MADTPRSIPTILTTLFQDGQTSGSISPQDMRDFTVTVKARTPFARVTDPEYGAIGNGLSNPASSKYGTLASLQAVYGTTISGVTVALTQELDWLATQLAINTVFAAGGGTVFFPGQGAYHFTNSNSVTDGSGTIMLPLTTTNAAGSGASVNLIGEAMLSTQLYWPNDLTTTRPALCCGPTTATFGNATGRFAYGFYEGTIANLTFQGPGTTPITLGSTPCNMDCLVLGARRHTYNVLINSFRYGLNFNGDYARFDNTYCTNCYYGIYSADANAQLYGGQVFDKCFSTGNSMAAIGISKNGQLSATLRDCYLGQNPYAVLLESGAASSYGQPDPTTAMNGCLFTHCLFEYTHNQIILDDNATVGGGGNTGTRSRGLVDVEFDDGFIMISGTGITSGGRGTYAYFDVSFYFNVKFSLTNGGSFLATSGMLAAFIGDTIGTANGGGVIFEGAMDVILPTYTTAGIPFLVCTNIQYGNFGIFGNGSNRYFRVVMPGQWSGTMEYIVDSNALPLNALLERGDYNGVKLGGTASAGTTTICGFNKQVWASASTGIMTVVATSSALQTALVTSAQTNSTLVKMGTGGHVVVATSVTDGQLVGWLYNNNGSSTSSVIIIPAFLGMGA